MFENETVYRSPNNNRKKMYPYCMSLCQKLQETDDVNRSEF